MRHGRVQSAYEGNDQKGYTSERMFGTLDKCWRPMSRGDFDLSERMVNYWANFIKNGDPNGKNLPEWSPCTHKNPHVQILDV